MEKTIEIKEFTGPLLPIIFVLSTSDSMLGTPIDSLNHGIKEMTQILINLSLQDKTNTVLKIGILQVHTGAHWFNPMGLVKPENVINNCLEAGGFNDIGAALNELDDKLNSKRYLSSTTGWCKPIIIFMTDGHSTDEWKVPLKKLNNNVWYKKSIKVSMALGDNADTQMLTEIVGHKEAVLKVGEFHTFSLFLRKCVLNERDIKDILEYEDEI